MCENGTSCVDLRLIPRILSFGPSKLLYDVRLDERVSTVIFGRQLLDRIVVERVSGASDLIPGAYRGFLGYEKVKDYVVISRNALSHASELFFFFSNELRN